MKFSQKISTIYWIIKHKIYVFYYIIKFCIVLIKRAILHDLTKFSKEEFEYVYKLSTAGKKVKFGSKEYYKLVDSVKSAKMAHSTRNSHHPEFYGSIYKMSILDLAEMLCDWCAATKRNNGNLVNSLKINKRKYKINKNLENILIKDMKEIGIWNS